MKKANLFACALVCISLIACERELMEKPTTVESTVALTSTSIQQPLAARMGPSENCNPDAYNIRLESRVYQHGAWEWVWSIQNPNPGNGRNGTAQDLSHWGMQFGTCIDPSAIINAGYSSDGLNWTNFTPRYQSDPSQSCMTSPVLKFDFGTTSTAKSYYRLIVNQEYTVGYVPGYYRSGVNTGCCTFYFQGIYSCGGPVEIEIVE